MQSEKATEEQRQCALEIVEFEAECTSHRGGANVKHALLTHAGHLVYSEWVAVDRGEEREAIPRVVRSCRGKVESQVTD